MDSFIACQVASGGYTLQTATRNDSWASEIRDWAQVPQVLPGGRHVLFTVSTGMTPNWERGPLSLARWTTAGR